MGEYAASDDALKKLWRATGTDAVRMALGVLVPTWLSLCGVSENVRYYVHDPRDVRPDREAPEAVQKISHEMPPYGTRRMAARDSRFAPPGQPQGSGSNISTAGWSEPARTKREIISANKKPPRPEVPNRFCGSDLSHVW